MMNNRIYQIDFRKLVIWHLPTFLRTSVRVIWLTVLVNPLLSLYSRLQDFMEESRYKLAHNSQVVYMNAVLNDQFDAVLRRIYIENVQGYEPVWYYDTNQGKPVYFYDSSDNAPVYHYDRSDFDYNNTDFIVHLPQDIKPADADELAELETVIKLLIDYYKLYSKAYQLKWDI
jgi:hypothetical protein